MKVPLLDLAPQLESLKQELHEAVLSVLDSTQYIMGKKVEELEAKVAEYCGSKYAVGVSSGTDALLIALMGLDVKPGDIVLTTDYSFFATAGVVARLFATPVFIDIDPETYNIDPASLKAWFDSNPSQASRVKAIIPVHLYGQCADMDAILKIANAHSVPVVEDAAQAIGALYPSKNGLKKAGSMGLCGCFSFFPSKNLGGIGDGGIVTTDDENFAVKLRALRNHGSERKYYHSMVGGNFRIDPIQAAVLLVKLPHLDSWHDKRRKNAEHYDSVLNINGLKKPALAYGRECHIYNQYIVSVPRDRDKLRKYLAEREVGHEVYYPLPFHLQECFRSLGGKQGDFPQSEHAAEHTLALPIFPELNREMQDYVAASIKAFYAS